MSYKHLPVIRKTVKEIIDLSSKSAILADSKSKQFCQHYNNLTKQAINDTSARQESFKVLEILCKEHGIKADLLHSQIQSLSTQCQNSPDQFKANFKHLNYEKLAARLRPEYYSLFQNLGRVTDGVKTLVKMREEVLNMLQDSSTLELKEDLKIMNSVLKNLLSLWFSIGLLNVKRINWNSPASLVEKVAHYESVHKMRTLSDLKARLSESRRCFIYEHSTMPYEPLVILHIALTTEVTASIKSLIKANSNDGTTLATATETTKETGPFTNAIFYSINSCQKGLQQVDLGNALIKSCVRLLLEELPNLKHFHTLSPIPKFREWIDLKLSADTNEHFNLTKALTVDELDFLKGHFKTNELSEIFEKMKVYMKSNEFRSRMSVVNFDAAKTVDLKIERVLAGFLQKACTFYLYYEKKNGYAFNSVANFHLKNGAHIYRVNCNGDLSDNGWKSSYGFMVNYGYKLDELDVNCIRYLIEKKIGISEMVEKDLRNFCAVNDRIVSKI